MKKYWLFLSLLTYCCLHSVATLAEENNFYKYKDKDGHTIISSSLPPEVANQGYEVISPMGNVISTVAPRKSNEEIQKEQLKIQEQAKQKKEAEKKQQEAEVQAHKDDILLQSFSGTSDIERSRHDKLKSIEVLEEIVKENLTGVKKQLTEANRIFQEYQKQGQTVPEVLKKTIASSEKQIKDGESFLERKAKEKKEINDKFDLLIKRFNEIQKDKTKPKTAPDFPDPAQEKKN